MDAKHKLRWQNLQPARTSAKAKTARRTGVFVHALVAAEGVRDILAFTMFSSC
jgi:hypothetical protein